MEAPYPKPSECRRKSSRSYITLPAVLAPAIVERIEEVNRGTFSQHAIETVCFDLRIRRAHSLTGQFARELPTIQDAIDRFIVAHYRPKALEEEGTLYRLIFGTLPPITRWIQGVGEDYKEPEKCEAYFPP